MPALGPTASAGSTDTGLSAIAAHYGLDPSTGSPAAPWQLEQARGANIWDTANFASNTAGAEGGTTNNLASLTPMVTGAAGSVWSLTRIHLPSPTHSQVLRVVLTVTTGGDIDSATGALYLRLRAHNGTDFIAGKDDSGNAFSADQVSRQYTFSAAVQAPSGNPLRLSLDFDYGQQSITMPYYFDVALGADGGSSTVGSTIQITDVSVHYVDGATPRLRASWDAANGGTNSAANLNLDTVMGRDAAGRLIRARQLWGLDGVTPIAYRNAGLYYDESLPYYHRDIGYVGGRNYPTAVFNVNNNDITMSVYKADGVTTEWRGNTHGGETGATGTYSSDVQVFLDYGDGNGWTRYLAQTATEYYRQCVRAKIVVNTKMTRTDQGSPFLTLTKTYYVYADGTIRYDRTVTWNQDQKVEKLLWWMVSNSPAPSTGNGTYQSIRWRAGNGEQVITNFDQAAYLTPPLLSATPTVSTSGGSIPSIPGGVYYSVKVTALDEAGGESLPGVKYSLVNVPSGAANTVAASWGAVTGASGYAIYFGLPGNERRVATVTGTSYTILGNETPGQPLSTINTANKGVGILQQGWTGKASWAAFHDPTMNCVMASALDRSAVASFAGGPTGLVSELLLAPDSFAKMYWAMTFSGGLTATIPSGTVWTDTAFAFMYMPRNPAVAFEHEVAVRSTSLAALADSVYPAT